MSSNLTLSTGCGITVDMAENPVHRLRQEERLTLAQFADRAGVHLQAVFLNERGVYPTILPSILSYMHRLRPEGRGWQSEYTAYVLEKRLEFGAHYDLPNTQLGPPVGSNPFRGWRDQYDLSRMAVAKGLCVHPASLYKVEHDETKHLPEQLVVALKVAGMPSMVIEELQFRLEEWVSGAWTVFSETVRVAS